MLTLSWGNFGAETQVIDYLLFTGRASLLE